MAVFDLDNLNPGTRFMLPDSTAWILLRKTPFAIMRAIVKETTHEVVTLKDGFRYVDDNPDLEKRNDMIWDYCIEDWHGIEDSDGNELVCNSKNKALLMNGSPRFSAFVSKCSAELVDMQQEKKEALEKN